MAFHAVITQCSILAYMYTNKTRIFSRAKLQACITGPLMSTPFLDAIGILKGVVSVFVRFFCFFVCIYNLNHRLQVCPHKISVGL